MDKWYWVRVGVRVRAREYPLPFVFIFFFFVFFEHNHTPSGKKMMTGVQVITTSQVQREDGHATTVQGFAVSL